MKKTFVARPVLGGCGARKQSVSSSEKVDIADIGKQLKKKAKYITVDSKYLDQVCDILDSEGVDYTFDRCNRGKDCKFHITY